MPSPNSTFTELVSTTFRKHRTKLVDNITNNNALLAWIKRNGMKRTEDGGLSIVEPLEYAENSTYQRYSGFDILNTGASDVFTAAEFDWKQIALNVVASGRELRINSGESKIINLAKSRLQNAMNTFANQFSVDAYSDGTSTNQIGGLKLLVSAGSTTGFTSTSTVGGINTTSTANAFWRNYTLDLSNSSITQSSTTIENDILLKMWLELVRGNDKPDLIIMSNEDYTDFEKSQTSIKRYTTSDTAKAGFEGLKYKTADVIFDGGSGITASYTYMLNTKYIKLVTHRDADLTVMDEMRPYNQDGVVIPILWMGNMTISNRSLQAVKLP
jgi:hypothetical protein